MANLSAYAHINAKDKITIEDTSGEPVININLGDLCIFLPREQLEALFNDADKYLHDEKETALEWQERALKAELECENKDDRIAYLEEQIDMLRFRG
jgi:hypothetical protein